MAIQKRKILFYFFLLSFLTSTPLVLLYASGYKIDFKNPAGFNLIEKTGMIMIETDPAQAEIFVNGKIQKPFLTNLLSDQENIIKTPAKIKGLLPEEYEVRLELPGYWSWNKKINVYPGQISHIQDVKLFKKTLPLFISPAEIQNIETCRNKKAIYLPTDGLLFDLKNEAAIEVATSADDNAGFSPDSKRLLAGDAIYDTKDGGKNIELKKILGEDASNIKWGRDSNKIFYQRKDSLNSFDLAANKNETLFEGEEYLDYLVEENQIFYIAQSGQAVKLKMRSLSLGQVIKELELPYSESYEFLDENNGLINLYDHKYKTLYLIDLFSLVSPLREIIAGAKLTDWIDNRNLLYANDFEIFIFNMDSGEKKLLTRLSEQITGLISAGDSNHILYSTEKSVNILEIGREDKLFSTKLLLLDGISAPVFGEDEKNIYFTAQIGDQKGLYKLSIK